MQTYIQRYTDVLGQCNSHITLLQASVGMQCLIVPEKAVTAKSDFSHILGAARANMELCVVQVNYWLFHMEQSGSSFLRRT